MVSQWTPDSDRIGSMERALNVDQQKILFDREATLALYSQTILVPGADQCGCVSCKNFAAQRSSAFPEDFTQFLKELGVDPLKEWEAFDYDFGPENPHRHLYGGWFLFAGALVGGLEKLPQLKEETFAYSFTNSFPAGMLSKDLKLCAVEFLVQIPWVLSELPG